MTNISQTDLILNEDGSVYHLNLKPGQVAENIILVGDPGRVHRISKHFEKIHFELNKREFYTHTGTYNGKPVTVISTGMGPDNIEIAITELDALFNIDLETRKVKESLSSLRFIRIGTSGGIQPGLLAGSTVAARYGIGFDNLMMFYKLQHSEFELSTAKDIEKNLELPFTPYCVRGSDSLFEKIAFDFIEGNTITCPGFYAPQGRTTRLKPALEKLLHNIMYYRANDFWLTNFEMETSAIYAFSRMLGHEALSLNAIIANRANQTVDMNYNKTIDEIILKVLERI
ncbi:MAG: nucleoside phosphorylase [Cyclobacteriaceae bacterium]|nr:nucleoside phosphorylase [Cyclobacteriaceae bacterium]